MPELTELDFSDLATQVAPAEAVAPSATQFQDLDFGDVAEPADTAYNKKVALFYNWLKTTTPAEREGSAFTRFANPLGLGKWLSKKFGTGDEAAWFDALDAHTSELSWKDPEKWKHFLVGAEQAYLTFKGLGAAGVPTIPGQFAAYEAIQAPEEKETLWQRGKKIVKGALFGKAVGLVGEYIPKARWRIPTTVGGAALVTAIGGGSAKQILDNAAQMFGWEMIGLAQRGAGRMAVINSARKFNPELSRVPADEIVQNAKQLADIQNNLPKEPAQMTPTPEQLAEFRRLGGSQTAEGRKYRDDIIETVAPAKPIVQHARENLGIELPEESETSKWLTRVIQSYKPARIETEQLRTAERAKRVAAAKEITARQIEAGAPAEEAIFKSTAALKGELPVSEFEIGMDLEEVKKDDAFKTIIERWPDQFKRINTATGLQKILHGNLPTDSEMALLEQTFGPEIGRELIRIKEAKAPLRAKILSAARVAWEAPRWGKLILDLGWPLRQGREISLGNPIESAKAIWEAKTGLRPGKYGERMARIITEQQNTDPVVQLLQSAGLRSAPIGREIIPSAEREETAAGYRARRFVPPWMRYTERYMSVWGNAYRTHFGQKIANQMLTDNKALDMQLQKGEITKEQHDSLYRTFDDFRNLATMLNRGTGRGTLGKAEKAAPYFSQVWLAPRLLLSKPQFLMQAFSTTPEVRKFVAKTLVASVANTMAAVGIGLVSGSIDEVELNPLKPNFGSFRINDTWYNPWGTSRRWVRLLVSVVSGQRKDKKGVIKEANRMAAGEHFLRGGVYGWAELGADVAAGRTFIGKPMPRYLGGPKKTRQARVTPAEEIYNIFGPISMQDMIEEIDSGQLDTQSLINMPLSAIGIPSYTEKAKPTGPPVYMGR